MSSGVDEPPGVQNFSSWPLAHAAGEVEQLAQRDAERRLVLARAGSTWPDSEKSVMPLEPLARTLSVPIARNQSAPLRTIDGTLAIDSTLLMTVGRRVEAGDGRERRAQPRLAAVALERVEQRRLLAADVGAGAGVHDDLEVEAGAEDVLAEVARGVRLGDRGLQPAERRARTSPRT